MPISSACAQGRKTTTYTVQPGETLLGIAHRHGTTLNIMLSLNPGMNPDYVQAGQTVVVPAGKSTPYVGSSSSPSMPSRPETKQEVGQANVGTVPQPQPIISYKDYKVKRKDTAYSLAKANGITVDELMAANPSLGEDGFNLKKGTVIRIPVKQYPPAPQYKGLSVIRVAVILPFEGKSLENTRSVEFYRGMLMGLEDLKNNGVSVTVSAWNEPAPDASIALQMSEVKSTRPDVIVGPLYPTHFNDVADASGKQTKVVVPFSSKVPQVDYRKDVYVINTPSHFDNLLQVSLFVQTFDKNDRAVVILHSSNGDRKSFCEDLQQRLFKDGYKVYSLPSTSSAAQIMASFKGKNPKQAVLVPDDGGEQTLVTLANTARDLRKLMPGLEVSTVGYEPWIQLSEGSRRGDLHEADAYVFTPNYYYPYTTAAQTFTTLYKKWFHADLVDSKPKMAPLGYDFSRTFLGNMSYYGYDYGEQSAAQGTTARQPKLQTDLKFMSVKGGGFVNSSMWLIHFKRDMSIVKISSF